MTAETSVALAVLCAALAAGAITLGYWKERLHGDC